MTGVTPSTVMMLILLFPTAIYNRIHDPTVGKDLSHPEVAGGQSDDGGLVQLARDGGGQGQQLAQLEKLVILLLPTVASGILALVLLRHGLVLFLSHLTTLVKNNTSPILFFPSDELRAAFDSFVMGMRKLRAIQLSRHWFVSQTSFFAETPLCQ